MNLLDTDHFLPVEGHLTTKRKRDKELGVKVICWLDYWLFLSVNTKNGAGQEIKELRDREVYSLYKLCNEVKVCCPLRATHIKHTVILNLEYNRIIKKTQKKPHIQSFKYKYTFTPLDPGNNSKHFF